MMLRHPVRLEESKRATPVIVVSAGAVSTVSLDAIDAVGGRLAAQLDWSDAAQALGEHSACAILLIDAEGLLPDVLMKMLPRLDAAAEALGIPAIIAFDQTCIDVVAAIMMSPRTHLLCTPTLPERIMALAVAAEQRSDALVQDVLRESETARLRRLNEEVARIAEVLARLTREDEKASPTIVSDHPTPFRQDHMIDILIDAAEVRRAIRARRMRDQHFGTGLFEDPAWDILLDLFAADLERSQVSVSSLCIAASVAPTTALRWIAKLADGGLLVRHPDPFDKRRAFVELSPTASRAMRLHVAALRRAGLPFG